MDTVTFTFYTEKDGQKSILGSVEVPTTEKNLFKKAVAQLRTTARDVADFLYIKSNHLYFFGYKVTCEHE